jgi:uncharacterized Zn finger protein
MARWYDRDMYFEPSLPRQAKGGIRAQSTRGSFGESWWGKRWIEVLESFDLGGRLQRGRSYARRGQVLSIEVDIGAAEAKVQGSRPEPYKVRIEMKQLKKGEWNAVAKALSRQVLFASKLLGGEMPNEMGEVFQSAGVSMFPARQSDLKTDCSCPDWSNPCKHVAAVYYLLGEEFDRDPFLIFRMRGMSRDGFISLLGESVPKQADLLPPSLPSEPLPSAASAFWEAGPLPEDLTGEAPSSPAGAALPRRLGKFPFWRGTQALTPFLDGFYERAASHTAELLERS